MSTETKSKPKSPISLAQAKELIAFARTQRVMVCEFEGLRFQFAPGAFEPDPEPTPAKNKPAEPESPFGHYKPE